MGLRGDEIEVEVEVEADAAATVLFFNDGHGGVFEFDLFRSREVLLGPTGV
jgi:hypothetical protein